MKHKNMAEAKDCTVVFTKAQYIASLQHCNTISTFFNRVIQTLSNYCIQLQKKRKKKWLKKVEKGKHGFPKTHSQVPTPNVVIHKSSKETFTYT